jgi:hypothetical protein
VEGITWLPNGLKSRQTKYWSYAGHLHPGNPGAAGGVNFLANRYDKSWDSTANKQFSLSDQTIKVVHDLKRDVHVDLLRRQRQLPRRPRLLDRYSALSPKFPRPAYLDPDRSPAKAKAIGFRPIHPS